MFSAFSGWVSSAADAVTKISDQSLDAVRQTGIIDALQSATLQASPTDTTSVATSLAVKDLMTPPTTWAGSVEEWVWCVTAALNDPNTCAITPATLKSDENLWQEIHSLITSLSRRDVAPQGDASTSANTAAEALATVEGTYTPSADLVAYIQAHESIYKVRSYVVPLFTSDDDYWLNIGWRLILYRLCANAGDLLAVMRTVSKLPARLHDIADAERRAVDESSRANRPAASAQQDAKAAGSDDEEEEEEEDDAYVARPHLTDNSEYWKDVQQQSDAAQEKFAWLRETQERVKKEMELARGNVKLLESLLQRQEAASPLSVSVSDSCKYHKVKLSRLIGDICAAPEENTKGTVLDSETGALFLEVFQCNEDVMKVLQAYAARGQESVGGSSKAPQPDASASTPTSPSKEIASARATSASPPQPAEARQATPPKAHSVASNSAAEVRAAGSVRSSPAAAKSDSDDEGSFEAKLPWAMDD